MNKNSITENDLISQLQALYPWVVILKDSFYTTQELELLGDAKFLGHSHFSEGMDKISTRKNVNLSRFYYEGGFYTHMLVYEKPHLTSGIEFSVYNILQDIVLYE